jgi:O-antigen ligase
MAEQALVYTIILVLTIVAPYRSLFLFVVISPWTQFASDILKWDPRLGWSVFLAIRVSLLSRNDTTRLGPRVAIWAIVSFALIAYGRLRLASGQIPVDDLKSCEIVLLYYVIGTCAAYAIVKMTDTRSNMLHLVSSAAWSLVLASAFALFQVTSGPIGARVSGTTGNPNSSAAHLALAATVMLLCWRLKLPGRWLCLVATVAAVAACIFTFSRMGAIACLIGLALTIQVTRVGKTVNWKLIAASVVVLTIMMGLTRSYLASVRNTHPDAGETRIAAMSQELEDLTRLEALQFSVQQFLEEPVFGVGFSTIAERNYAANGLFVTSHNTYAQVLAGTGLVGGALIVLAIVGVFRRIPPSMTKYLIPLSAEVGFCAFFGDFLQSIELFVIVAVLLAVLRQFGQPAEHPPIQKDALIDEATGFHAKKAA